jgi:autotransporter strand-loop-strand O-heptosyltransferase
VAKEKPSSNQAGDAAKSQERSASAPASAVAAAPASASASASASAAPSSAVTDGSAPEQKRAFPAAAEIPTQIGPQGIKFDFNDGCRVLVPEAAQPWRVRLSDLDTGNILFETTLKAGRINSTKRYFLRARIEVWSGTESVLSHDYDCKDKEVTIQLPIGTVGDTMGWFPYAARFGQVHKCKLSVVMADKLIPLFKDAYPEINFIVPEAVTPEKNYATYNIGLFFDDEDRVFQPADFRLVGLHRTAGYILGVDPKEEPPKIVLEDESRPIPEPYVCIAVQSTTQAKYWNNPTGWREIVTFLKAAGYRVICIDRQATHGNGLVWNHIPYGAEDETGDRPLAERARWLRHCDFFVGLSSGLSWLAWASGAKVVMISGFTAAVNEFDTPYRVINYHACNSCWNDPRLRFDHKDFVWCPRHKETPRQFECTRLITAEQVKSVLRRIPGFGEHKSESAANIVRMRGTSDDTLTPGRQSAAAAAGE